MSRLRGEITIEEIDDWFAIGAKSVKNTKSVPRTATGGRFFNTETQSARVPQQKVYVPSYNQPSYNATAYAEAYKIEEEQDLFNSQSQTNNDFAGLSGKMEHLDLESIVSGSVAVPDDLVPENATDVYNSYNFDHRYDQKLPITQYRDQVLATIESNQVTVIQGSTGSGKTTQVPQYILDHYASMGKYCNIIVTQPRRIAAMSIARRVCSERNWDVGTICGYQVGMDRTANEDTRLLYVTTGVLLRKLIKTKNMLQFTHVILDEVHERDQETDFSLLIVRKLLRSNSRHVKVVMMSATFDSDMFGQYFAVPIRDRLEPAPVVCVEGKAYNVSEYYADDLTQLGEIPPLDETRPEISELAYILACRLIQEFDNLDIKKQGGIGVASVSSVSINTCKSEMRLTIERITQTVSLQDYNFVDFDTWLASKDLPSTTIPLPEWAATQLVEELGVAKYVSTTTCYDLKSPFIEADAVNGWKNDCVNVTNTQVFDSGTSRLVCSIPVGCSGATCCMDIPRLNRSLEVSMLIEPCTNKLLLKIDKMENDLLLSDVTFGVHYKFSLYGIINIEYTIREVDFEDQYEVNMTLTVCFDSTTCEIEHPVFINTILIKEVCNWTSEFKTPDFSMSLWLSDRNLTMTSDLNDINADELLQDLGLTDFMGSTSLCDHGISPFNTLTDGWNNECTTPGIVLSSISHPAACHANSDCNRFSCCIEVDILKRSLFAAVYLNPCRYNLQVQLEQLTIDVDLFTYTWGERKQYFLYGVFRLEFMINHVATERVYVVDVNIKVCFEAGSGSSCYQEITVLEDTRIQYPNCSTSGLESLPFDG
ncbi:ATP-dependent RNA helicase TDRD9 [Mytilus galloprovincialis]|uniref:ATP-dependent RNA helicase TDRD9 n=1 Tax=Mytilus galloprovincialis TaxID=29158 RepID=A0A8B6BU98_MYTGA|nr:ATP-dependent RNA helicase TDRD9 [Mytilus galloprovincialis]